MESESHRDILVLTQHVNINAALANIKNVLKKYQWFSLNIVVTLVSIQIIAGTIFK